MSEQVVESPKSVFDAFDGVTDERLLEYTEKQFWLNRKTKQFFYDLTETQVPPGLSLERKGHWRDSFMAASLDISPLIPQQVGLQEAWDNEMAKPLKVEPKKVPAIIVEADAVKRVHASVAPYIAEDGSIPADKVALMVAAIVKKEIAVAKKARSTYKKEVKNELDACCRNTKTLIKLSKAICSTVMNRSKLLTPIKEESLTANRMMEDGFLTDTLFKGIAHLSVWTYWKISQALNSQWGRLTMQNNEYECIKVARKFGQLGEDEVWDDEGNPVKEHPWKEAKGVGLDTVGSLTRQ